MPEIGPLELIIVAFVVLLLFGPGKAADLGSSLGKSIREFRRETTGTGDAAPPPSAIAKSPARFCTECGSQNATDQNFCTNCGASLVAAV
jgi:TatA/E family protein of Tat protein translocase